MRLIDWELEESIDEACIEANLDAKEYGENVTVHVCAGPTLCADWPCAWCTTVNVSPNGPMARWEPGHA